MSEEPAPQDDRESNPVAAYRAAWQQAFRNLRYRLAPLIALLETLGPTESEADAFEHDVRSAIHDLWRGDRDELTEWAPRIRQAAARAKDTHVLMNNCYAN